VRYLLTAKTCWDGARLAHNREVAGSNPAPATIYAGQRPLPVPEGAFLLRLVHGFVNERAGTARLGADVIVLTMSLVPGLRRPLLWPSSNRGC